MKPAENAGRGGQSRVGRALAVVWLLALAAGVVMAALHAWIGDDIYITFRYCDNVLAGYGPVYNPGERSEGYTHFLWFILLVLGRALQSPADLLGKYLPLPFYAGCLALLVLLSRRLFPGRGGLAGVPVAALAWAAHGDARIYASSGLETSAYIFTLLLGFWYLCASTQPRRHALAAWALGLATLLRPDALLYAGCAGLYLLWQRGWRQRQWLEFGVLFTLLALPLFAFRLLYYGYLFPNPYYAKSASLANWPQGWVYLRTYFEAYFVLLLAPLAIGLLLHRRGGVARAGGAAPALALALTAAAANIFTVTRMGGDFMFARFYLPATPLLLLAIEALVHQLPRRSWRLAGTAVVVGLVLYAGVRKQVHFSHRRHVKAIVDEPQYYPDYRLDDLKAQSEALERCLAGTGAVLMVQGGQASLAYYSHFPVAIERYGLTDAHIAHSPAPPIRGRPGHEKLADAQYIFDRRVNFRIHARRPLSLKAFTQFGIPWTKGMTYGEIIVYDRALMEQLKSCPGIRFLDFPLWLRQDYLPFIGSMPPERVAEDYNHFIRFYFDHNADPEGLRAQLDTALAQHGIQKLQPEPLRPEYFEDTGRTTMPGG